MSADTTRLRIGLQRWAFAVVDRTLDDLPDAIRAAAPIGTPDVFGRNSPGELRRSIARGGSTSGDHRIGGTIVAPVIQAQTTDQGAPPHVIRPHGKYPLVFYWPKVGTIVRSYGWHGETFGRVDHPGNVAQNWWRPALVQGWREGLIANANDTPLVG